ncbi:MAG: hypothetical protein E4H27_10700, partial [Anaerolineales bacterium]
MNLFNRFANFPDIWGEGALFAYSGMDGPTNTCSHFVAALAAQPFSLLIHTPRRRFLHMAVPEKNHPILITGDVIAAETHQGLIVTTFESWHTIVGLLPAGTPITLAFEAQEPPLFDDDCQTTWDPEHHDAIVLCVKDQFWSLAYGTTVEQATIRARNFLSADETFEAIILRKIREHLLPYGVLPQLKIPEKDQLLKKCFSVMKVNTLSSEGVNVGYWSTPDRVPHRHMWLWDSVFHTFGMNSLNPELSWEFLKAVLERQCEDGMIPHMMRTDGTASQITQPPVLAWGVWENYQVLKDKSTIAYALPKLERYLAWNLTYRDKNNNHLLEWHITQNPISRSGESGMDNSQRFDTALTLDAVDFSTFQALDMAYTAEIAEELHEYDRATMWRTRAAQMSAQIHNQLWDAQDEFYYDRMMDGGYTHIKAVSGFLPLLLQDIPSDHVLALVAHLGDITEFNTTFPVPSVASGTPDWSTDMWRGATWINMNYLVMVGLHKQGHLDEAARLKEKTLYYVEKYYRQYGVIFEFYDAKDKRPPVACDRKGQHQVPYNIRNKMDS